MLRPLALLATAELCVFALASCGNESDGVFEHEGFPFTFEYPDDFEETDDVTVGEELGVAADESAAIGIEENDLIAVQSFTLQAEVDQSNLDLAKREVDGLVRQLDPDASTQPTEVAGLPALSAENVIVPGLEGGESRLTIIFDGDTEYVFNCQSTPERRAEVDEACDLALETLEFE